MSRQVLGCRLRNNGRNEAYQKWKKSSEGRENSLSIAHFAILFRLSEFWTKYRNKFFRITGLSGFWHKVEFSMKRFCTSRRNSRETWMKEPNGLFWREVSWNCWEIQYILRFLVFPQCENSRVICRSRSVFQMNLSFSDPGRTTIVKKTDPENLE